MRASEPPQRASWWEVLGAWLRVWTPPRDVEIPSPRRALIVAVVAVAALTAVVVTVVAPAIDRAKDRDAARAAREHDAATKAQRARLIVEQRAHPGRAALIARLYAAGDRAASVAALLVAARASIGRDARARVAAGDLSGPVRSVRCSPRARELGERVHLDCLAVTATAQTHARGPGGQIGHPFVVGASLRDGRYAWCKGNGRPGEGSYGKSVQVTLPVACRS